MKRFTKSFFVESEPGQFQPTELVIEFKQEYVQSALTYYAYALTFPIILDREIYTFSARNELETLLNVVDKAREDFKVFCKNGGRLYEADVKGRPWTQYGPLKPKDFLRSI
jgi:hypothetical protein